MSASRSRDRIRASAPAPLVGVVLCVLVLAFYDNPATAESSLLDEEVREAAVEPSSSTDSEGFNGYADLSLEELLSVKVSSVSGVRQDWFETPAAIYVITREDIRRSGHVLLPEALRLAPGMTVQRVNSSKWAIGARGFAERYANKLQVLIDGRVVYYPFFSGTFWETQSLVLEDLDRIEVIRGPGATLWGANAVNGVVNVTTRTAEETQGLYTTAGFGTEPRGFGAVRYGDAIGDDTWYRVWATYYNGDSFDHLGGGEGGDDWDFTSGGFRLDHDGADDVVLTLQGGLYGSDHVGQETLAPDPSTAFTSIPIRQDWRYYGGYLLGRIGKDRDNAGWSLQAYYDGVHNSMPSGLRADTHTIDIDWRHHFLWGERQEIVWGAGYRHIVDDTRDVGPLTFDPADRQYQTISAFVQDTFTLVPDRVFVMVGSKFEHNDFSGFEIQPSARAWWTPNDRHTVWGAVSRAVRTPSRTDHDLVYTFMYGDAGVLAGGPPNGVLVPLNYVGDDSLDSEELIAFELGHRVRVTDDFTLDTALFYNDYDRLITAGPDFRLGNIGEAESYGAEISATWRVAENWRIEASYSAIHVDLEGGYTSGADNGGPEHQFQVRSYLDLTEDLELNSAIYFLGADPANDTDAFARLDVGVTWRPRSGVEIAVWGQNLLDDRHLEASDPTEFYASEVPRGVYGSVTLRF